MSFDFGKCPCGGGKYKVGSVTVRMTVQGRQIEMLDVAQGSCSTCTSRVYKADTLRRIESVMRAEPRDAVVAGRRRLSSAD